MICKRTKNVLAANKARGTQLSSPQNLTLDAIAQGWAVMQRHGLRGVGLHAGQGCAAQPTCPSAWRSVVA